MNLAAQKDPLTFSKARIYSGYNGFYSSWTTEGSGSRFSTKERYSLLQNIQNVSGTRDVLPGVSQLKRKAGYSPQSKYGFKIKWTYTSTPTYVFMEEAGANLVLPSMAIGGTPIYGLLCYDVSRWNVYFHRHMKLIFRHAGTLVYNTLLRIIYQHFKAYWLSNAPTRLTFNNCTLCPHSVFSCFVFIWEQTVTCATYIINGLAFITEKKVFTARYELIL